MAAANHQVSDNHKESVLFVVEQDGSICQADVINSVRKKLPGLQEIAAGTVQTINQSLTFCY